MSLLESGEPEFCAVYGRRRVGKTYLIRETFRGRFAFQHTGLANASKREQLSEFYASLKTAGLKTTGKERARTPKDWHEAFHMLANLMETLPVGKKIIFLDELSWLDTQKSNFISALEHFWNGRATARIEKDILLIVCGSATSWLISKLFLDHGGLHNRVTRHIYLQPFTLHECEEYAQSRHLNLSRQDIAEGYMVWGGIPYYWSFLLRNESLAQAIDRLFFAENAPLSREYSALYASLFKNFQKHMAIVTALCKRKAGMTRRELLNITKFPDNSSFTNILKELEQCNFIRRFFYFSRKEREATYQLMDNFTLFHFQYIKANQNHDSQFWTHNLDTPLHHAWEGLAFKRLCLWHLPQIYKALGINGISVTAHSWRTDATEEHPGAQVDLLISRSDRTINLCEMKYYDGEYSVTSEEAAKLRQRSDVFRQVTKTRNAIALTLISTYGARHSAAANVFNNEITLNELF